jgi:predicted ribosome quality control (RQC) complex YloA/Tae2 family protein
LDTIAVEFSTSIRSLLAGIILGDMNNCITRELETYINQISNVFSSSLKESTKYLKPIAKIRKSLAGIDLSNLDENKGLIIDQIWDKFGNIGTLLQKDVMFGKKPINECNPCESYPKYLQIVSCYMALNYLGYWPDQLSKVRRIPGITSDASHVGYASFCSAILSEDRRLCKKAEAVYQYLNIDTAVCQIKVG